MTRLIPRALGLLASLVLIITACTRSGGEYAGIDGTGTPGVAVALPSIVTISPTSAIAGSDDFALTVNGNNFVAGSTVQFGGRKVTSAFVSSTQLIGTVPAAAIATAGSAEVSVANPGGAASSPVKFTINEPFTPGSFNAIGNMITAREGHAAVLLPNGKVLIAGGAVAAGANVPALASAELYDPSTRSFSPTGNMTTAREGPRAVLLSNGKVLVAGGAADLSAEIYDPATETFTPTGSMMPGGMDGLGFGPLTLLENGDVFVAANVNAQIYDPDSGTFFLAVGYPDPTSSWGTSNLLQDGRVLLTGCASQCNTGATALYNPVTNTFSTTGAMPGRSWFNLNTGTSLMNGQVLIVGDGCDRRDPAGNAELYDPAAGAFTSLGNTVWPHEYAAAVRLTNGMVLIVGGQLDGGSGSAGADLYDSTTGHFTSAGNMTVGRHSHTATLLNDGTVLIAGGYSSPSAATYSAEIYQPTQ